MLGAAIKSALGFRRSAVRPVARAGRGVLSTVKAAGGGGALPCAAELTAARSELFVARSALCGPYDFGPAADDIEESFRKLGAGVTAAAALPFGDSSDACSRIKPAGLLGSHVAVRCMSTGSAGAGATSLRSGGAAAVTGSNSTSGDSSEAPTPTPTPPKACALPKVVLVKAGDKGRYIDWAIKWDQLKDMRTGGLLTALKADDVFGPDLKDVKFSGCSVELFKLPTAQKVPTAADEADASKFVELEGADTVGAVWSTIDTADATQLCIRVRLPAVAPAVVADPTRLPARPVPIAFEAAGFNDSTGSPMYVVTLDDGYPFYLEQRALEQVKDWASGEVSKDYAKQKLVVLTGPIKCGKTKLLELMSRLLAADSRRKPVVLAHTFTIRQGPHDAALYLVQAAERLAKELGFEIAAIPTSGEAALAGIPGVMRKLAEGIAAAGGELILLLDEAQAPILAAGAPADATHFAAQLKAIHAECRATSRIAITGSGLMSLLNSLRSLPPNGYALWGAMARVHLGATPAPAAARTMADAIIGARSHAWPQAVKALVTPDYVLGKLTPPVGGAASPTAAGTAAPPLTSARPALVALLAELLCTAAVGDADAVADVALSELSRKLNEEANVDAAVALASLEEGQRKTVYCLAAGKLDRKALEKRLGEGERQRFTELLHTLCEPSSDPDATLTLLPPYGALFTTILDEEGALLVEWMGNHWELTEKLRDRLKFFGEHYLYLIQHQRSAAEAVSAAVLQAMAVNGHGIATGNPASPFRPVATLAEMESLPVFRAIRSVLNDQQAEKATAGGAKLSPSMATFGEHMAAAADPTSTAERAADYVSVMGLHMLVWLRHIEAHAYISKDVLIKAKLTGSVLEHWMRSALGAWEDQGLRLNDKGVPIRPRKPAAAAASRIAARRR